MRIFHFSDTHLGHQQFTRLGPDGINQRESDHARAFLDVIDAAVADRPDLLIHAGDLFDGVRPGNRALAVAMDGFLRLSKAGIPWVLIAGNHEHPKMRETGSAFRLFEHLEGGHVAFQGRREQWQIAGGTVHAVPQCTSHDALRQEVMAARRGPGPNILVLHGAVQGLDAFKHAEFNEQTLDPAWFDDRFDYVALGHFHGRSEISQRVHYCGATERVSMAESGRPKGFLDVDLSGEPKVRFRELSTRAYVDLPAVHAQGLDGVAIEAAATAALSGVPEGAVVRLRIEDVDGGLRGALDRTGILEAAGHALHVDLDVRFADSGRDVAGAAEFGALSEEFDAFLAAQPIERLDRKRLRSMVHDLLEAA